MKNKIINSIFYLSITVFIASSCFLSFSLMKKPSQAAGGYSWGGRIISVTPEVTSCPVGCITTCLSGCNSNNCVIITPYGGTALPTACLPISMQTSGPPITTASVGGQILGLFSTLSQLIISVPLGIVGTSQ